MQDDGSYWLDVALQMAASQPDPAGSSRAQTMSAQSMLSSSAGSQDSLSAVQRKVTKLTRQATERPTPMTLGLLNRALVCAQLAARAYRDPYRPIRESQQFWNTLPEVAGCKVEGDIPKTFTASLVEWHKSQEYTTNKELIAMFLKTGLKAQSAAGLLTWLQKNSTKNLPFIQWDLWYVEDLGYVTAFKGSTDAEDWMANFLITGKQLDHAPEITVHEGMYSRVKVAWNGADGKPGILQYIKEDAEANPGRRGRDGQIPVLLTGV